MIIEPKGYVVPSDKLGSKDVSCLPRLCWLNIGFWGRYVITGSGTESSHYHEETQVFLGIIDAWISSVDDWLAIQKNFLELIGGKGHFHEYIGSSMQSR